MTTLPSLGATSGTVPLPLVLAPVVRVWPSGGPQGEDDVALAEDGGRRGAGASAGRYAGLERVGHGDDVDSRARRQGGADRLRRIDRQGEGDLAGGQRCPEAEGALAWRLLQRAAVDGLAGEDRQRGVLTDDLVDRMRGVGRGVGRADPDRLDHVGRDLGELGHVDSRAHDVGPRLGEDEYPRGDEPGDEEDDDVGGAADTHRSGLLQWLTAA